MMMMKVDLVSVPMKEIAGEREKESRAGSETEKGTRQYGAR